MINKLTARSVALIFLISMIILSILLIISVVKTLNTFSFEDNAKRIAGAALGFASAIFASLVVVATWENHLKYSSEILHVTTTVIGILALSWVIDSKVDFVVENFNTHSIWIAFLVLSLSALSFDLFRVVFKHFWK